MSQYDTIIEREARANGVDPAIIRAMMAKESAGDTAAISPKGAQGLLQLMPRTAASLGVTDPHNPEQNIRAGVKYFAQMKKRFGSTELALAAYNAGPGNVRRHGNTIPPFKETQDYVRKIMATLGRGRTRRIGAGGAATALAANPGESIDGLGGLFAPPVDSRGGGDIASLFDFEDYGPLVDALNQSNQESGERISVAGAEARKSPANIVDKLGRVAQLVAYLSDITSGSTERQRGAVGAVPGVLDRGRASLDARRQEQRDKLRSVLAEEELTGKQRANAFSAEASAIGARNKSKSNVARATLEKQLSPDVQLKYDLTKRIGEVGIGGLSPFELEQWSAITGQTFQTVSGKANEFLTEITTGLDKMWDGQLQTYIENDPENGQQKWIDARQKDYVRRVGELLERHPEFKGLIDLPTFDGDPSGVSVGEEDGDGFFESKGFNAAADAVKRVWYGPVGAGDSDGPTEKQLEMRELFKKLPGGEWLLNYLIELGGGEAEPGPSLEIPLPRVKR